ncbi:TRAPP II complex [Mycena belliarum]|uniref:TRAPP II complex n=1 Tax=Mycena belliarum TaxID=1033014 RepID=A0AAD6XWH5_9AGAR|nr:TRAPP II complex [Mycena belliae]
MDTHAFASLAQVRILLVPVGTIPQATFDKYAAELRTFDTIRLGDIPADNKDERARFMPNPLSTGYLHLSFPTHPPPFSHLPLSLLRPSNFPLAVIGLAVCSNTDSLPSILSQFNAALLDIFPAGGMYPLAKNCFVFEEGEENTNLNLGNSLPSLVVIPSMMGNKKLYVGTLLADLCSHVLGEFGSLVQGLESPAGNEHLNSALMPMLPAPDLAQPLDSGRKRDSLPPLPSHNGQPEIKTAFNLSSAPNLKRNSSSGGVFRQSTLSVPPPKKRLSSLGVASSHGRLFKVLGDFFLLAGRTEDAAVWYNEAILLFRSSSDAVWQAATLEGMATVSIIDAWSAGQGLNTSTSASREPWTDVFEKLSQAITLYHRSPAADGEHNYSLLAYLYSCAVLRQSSLLFSVWSAKGWGPLAFSTMLQPGPTPYLPPTLAHEGLTSWASLERLSTISGVSRSSISTVLAQVHGPWLLHLGPRERISILESTASLYACLGYRRKEAYILREVLGCILDLIVCGREEDGFSRLSSVPLPTGTGIQGLNSGSSQRGNVGVRFSENIEGNESVLKLLKYVCKVLGINLDAVRLLENSDEGPPEDQGSLSNIEDDAATEFAEPYGWPELQVGVVREAVAVAEALPDYLAVAQFALSSLKTLQTVLAPGDQYHLYTTSTRALMTAHRRGDSKSVEYWSGKPIVSINLSALPLVRLPIEKPFSALQQSSSEIAPILTGGTDPFLYNPRRALGQGKSLVVQNELLEFVVVLKNPYVFDLEIQSLSLSTSGVLFDTKPVRVILPATAFHVVTLSGKATETGALAVRGCFIQAPGGTKREFTLPISTGEEEERISRKRAAIECEAGRSKYTGLDCFPWEKASKRASTQVSAPTTKAPLRFLEYTVVPEQPLLRIRRTSVTHGAVMMYNGEMSTIRITLENVSPLPIDFLRFVFDDSTISPAQQALANGELSVFDTYETEYDLLHRPVFSWSKEDTKDIPPGHKLTVNVNCFGKVGCTSGTIHVSYSYVHRPTNMLDPSPQVFHTRQLSYPVMVTVYHMLECHGMDILPFPSHPLDLAKERTEEDQYLGNEAGWCLFSVEVRNTYGLPFEVSFERIQQDRPRGTTTTTVSPGSTSRMVMPIQKFILSEDHISQPIPTLSDRQFVVTKSKLSKTQERAQRELFWYREELFKTLRGRWREAGGTRSGDLSLRQQRMTLPMLETLRTETASIQMSLYSDIASQKTPHISDGKYYPQASEFVYLRTKVTNLSLTSLAFTLDFDFQSSPHVIFEGLLRDVPIGRLESGESHEIETGLCFLAYGRYEISAEAKVVGSAESSAESKGRGRLTAMVRAEG